MDKLIGVLVAVLVVGSSLTAMMLSWRQRVRRDAGLTLPHELPDGAEHWSGSMLYLASTLDDATLERVAIRGLGFRGRAKVTVSESGVLIHVDGEAAVGLPSAWVTRVETRSWTIDRGIGTDGVLVVVWAHPDSPERAIVSAFRAADPEVQRGALSALRQLVSSTTNPSEGS